MSRKVLTFGIILLLFVACNPASARTQILQLTRGESVEIHCDAPLEGEFQETIWNVFCPPEIENHDVTKWHEPTDHHHGYSVTDTEFASLWLEMAGQEIAYPWLSSSTENGYPYPDGKHEGFKGLYEEDTGCENFNGITANCIKSYFMLVHTLGTVHAIHTRFHSFALAAMICNENQCGKIFTGGVHDYGVLHNQYKETICELPGDHPNYPYDTQQGIHQPPYRTGHNTTDKPPTNGVNAQFWNSMINREQSTYYPHSPNYVFNVTWFGVDAWGYINGDSEGCSDPAQAVNICPDGSCEYNGSRFQVFEMLIKNLPTQRPFQGFTNVNGQVDMSCTATSANCIPLYIEKSVPQGAAILDRQVRQGDCGRAPCQEFDPGDGRLTIPGY